MKSVKRINKVLGSFDKVIKDLNKAQDDGLKEIDKNNDECFELRRAFDNIRSFVFSMINKLKAKVDRKVKKIEKENEEILESVQRAGRVRGKIEDLLK